MQSLTPQFHPKMRDVSKADCGQRLHVLHVLLKAATTRRVKSLSWGGDEEKMENGKIQICVWMVWAFYANYHVL